MIYPLATIYFAFFCAILAVTDRLETRSFIYGVAMLFVIGSASALNTNIGLIEEKFASFIAYDAFRNGEFTLTFFVQYLLAWIPMALLDYEYVAHAMNIGLQAFLFMLGARYLFGVRLNWQLLAFSLFPSYYHYAIFGLRDPLISLVTLLVVLAAIKLRPRQFVVVCIGLSIVSIGIRPEFALVILGFAMLRVFFEASNRQRVLITLVSLAGLYVALLLMPLAFGISGTGSASGNIEQMIRFNEIRNERRLGGDGGGSHILGGQLFQYPFLLRYPIQLVASFLAPLPFEIRGALDAIAFIESVIFCGVTVMAFLAARRHKTASLLFWCGFAFMALQALFAINYGNILRIRYPAFIFFLGATVAESLVQQQQTRMWMLQMKRRRTKGVLIETPPLPANRSRATERRPRTRPAASERTG